MEDEEDTDVEVLDGDEVVEVSGAEIQAELGDEQPVTKPHDGGEWLAGFKAGVKAGRNDTFAALRRALGDGPLADDVIAKVVTDLDGS